MCDGNAIKGSSPGVNATLRVRGGAVAPQDSFRWLMGEDSTAFAPPGFSGAIRDMWTPTCLGDPGKVTDAEYHCDVSDGGGVHSNSGVPNHGYALLVDGTGGGQYNGQTINAIGLTKAAHIFWRSHSFYLTEASDFVDHANALEASCTDLIGDPLNELNTAPGENDPSGEVITAADCLQVTAMIAAVELRTDPTQCNFQPLLNPNTPRLCPDGQRSDRIYRERFEDRRGLRGWTLSNEGVFSGWPGTNWVQDRTLPDERRGRAAFAANPLDAGDCGGGAGDVSGVMRLESPVIRINASRRTQSIRLTFDHYVATEALWDGGNVKISINGGPYVVVPATAFLFNPYNYETPTPRSGEHEPAPGSAWLLRQ